MGQASQGGWGAGGPCPAPRRPIGGRLVPQRGGRCASVYRLGFGGVPGAGGDPQRRDVAAGPSPRATGPATVPAQHRDVPLPVGPVEGYAPVAEGGEGARRGVAVAVVRADRDHGEAGRGRRQQPGVLVRGTVVRDLEHVDTGRDPPGTSQCPLARRLQVSKEQEGQPGGADQQGEARVVGAVREAEGLCVRPGRGGWPEHLPAQPALRPAGLPRRRDPDRDTRPRRGAVDQGGLRRWVGEGGRLDQADRAAAQDPGEATGVVGVEVRQDDQGYAADPEHAQAPVDGERVGARVDDDGRARPCGEDERVALADITEDHAPPRGRPPGDDAGHAGRLHHEQHQQHRDGEGDQAPPAQQTAGRQDHGHRDDGQECPTSPAARPAEAGPRQRGPRARHLGDPPGGQARAPGDQLGGAGQHGRQRQGGEAEHGGRGHGELRDEVAGDRDQPDPRRQHRDDRRADRLGRRCRRHRLGDPGRHPALPERLAPAGCEQQQRPRGEHRQQEAVAARQPRVPEGEQQHRGGERRDQAAAAAGGDGQQGHGSAGGGPHHAGFRPADDHEGKGQCPARDGRGTQAEPEQRCQAAAFGPVGAARRPDEQSQHDGEVGAADRHEMGQVGGPERLPQVVRDPPRVADDQGGQQRPRIRLQPVGGCPETGAQLPRDPLEAAGRTGHHGRARPGGPQDGGMRSAGVERRGEPPGQPQPRRGQQPAPPVTVRPVGDGHDQQHGRTRPDRRAGRLRHADDAAVDQQRGRPPRLVPRRPTGPPYGTGVPRHLHLGSDPRMPPGQLRHGPPVAVGPVQPGRSGSCRRAEQSRRGTEPDPPQPGHRRLREGERGHRAASGLPLAPGPEPATPPRSLPGRHPEAARSTSLPPSPHPSQHPPGPQQRHPRHTPRPPGPHSDQQRRSTPRGQRGHRQPQIQRPPLSHSRTRTTGEPSPSTGILASAAGPVLTTRLVPAIRLVQAAAWLVQPTRPAPPAQLSCPHQLLPRHQLPSPANPAPSRPAPAPHGRTSSLRSSKRRSPMPRTSRSWSTDRKPPFSVR